MSFFRKRLNAETCLSHPWIGSIPSQQERDLSANKNNLKNAPKNNNYYLFDSTSKTMSMASNDVVNEDDEWEWYEEDDENNAETNKPTNAETIFAQHAAKAEPVFTLNQVQARVAEITTKPNTDPVWQTAERMLSPLYEMASVSSSPMTNSSSTATIVKVNIDQPVILTCGKKRRSDECSVTPTPSTQHSDSAVTNNCSAVESEYC